MKPAIVLDKSYLDGAPTQAVMALCDEYEALMPEELFYELITTRPESQKRCFSKLPDRVNPVLLVPSIGTLLRAEMEHQAACTPIEAHRGTEDYEFNRKLREGTYVPEGDVLRNLEEWKASIADDTKGFIQRWAVVHHFFPELNGIDWKDFPATIQSAREKVATDDDFVRTVYASFLDEDAPKDSPRPEAISREWVFFRWVQCQVLASLRLFGRYQGRVPESQGQAFVERIEHSMLDSYYLIYGSLVGRIATLDDEVREDFVLLQPNGVLVPPTSVS